MAKHITIRMAWHDDKWNGRICREPEANVHCIGNYSLLSTRIQRRRRLSVEQFHRGQEVSRVIEDEKYVPPCYWSINAFGNNECVTTDPHPFADVGGMQERFSREVSPIVENLKPHSVFTWYFRLGYAKEGSLDRYVPREELKERVEEYLRDIEPGKSIGLLYANYSNPVTGDKRKYLLIGAGLVKQAYEPKEFEMPDALFNDVTSRPRMRNFPKILWRFQLEFDPNTLLLLPYHEYLDYIERSALDREEEQKKLEEMAIPIDEGTIVQNFKYVCRPLSSSKCLYALYLVERSLRKMKEHGIIEHSCLKDIEAKLNSLIEIAWRERGKYPGFRNLVQKMLGSTYPPTMQRELTLEIQKIITTEFGDVQNFLQTTLKDDDFRKIPIPLRRAFRIIERDKALVEFLSLFDFSRRQFDNALEIVDNHGLETIKRNPYILLEDYLYESKDSWKIDETDFGVALFEIDMALIPDPRYVDWDFPQYDALSPERLRSVVATILYDAAISDGISYLSREEIVDQAKEYPLYYIHEGLEVDAQTLSKYEKQTIFQEKFSIVPEFRRHQVLYQLKIVRNIEETIELFVNRLSKKNYTIDDKDIKEIEATIKKESEIFKEKLNAEERRLLYKNAMKSGLFVLTGKAGSGKTTAIRNLVEKFKEKKKLQIFIFTPTGKASLVVKNRLRDMEYNESQIRISTIHRFLFTAPFEYKDTMRYRELYEFRNLIERILDGQIDLLNKFKAAAKNFMFSPKVVIIDEVSMVDEVLLTLLFSLINPDTLEHLILVGDEKQLPPIGIGRPLTDIVFNLKKTGQDSNLIHLESDLRFPANKSLGKLAGLFIGEDPPTPVDFEEILQNPDETIRMESFSNLNQLQNIVRSVLAETGKTLPGSVFEMFKQVIEKNGTLNLDQIQILSPRKYGSYGSEAINIRGVLLGEPSFRPGTKLICEENIYHTIGSKKPRKRILGLANGSIGYVKNSDDLYFEDIEDLAEEFGENEISVLKDRISDNLYSPTESHTPINFGYAITVHKSQGSDFDNVILVLSEVSPFITRELLYTALTRPRRRIHLVTHADLSKELCSTFTKAYSNSEVERRRTLLFGEKDSPFKPFYLTKKNGQTIQVMSKIEYIIAKVLDDEGIAFETGPTEFLREHHLIPDFKLSIDGESYYWEHLGGMDDLNYRERWYRKFRTYSEKIQVADRLVTTSEDQKVTDTEKAVKKIVSDLRSGKLTYTEGAYSHHHYYI